MGSAVSSIMGGNGGGFLGAVGGIVGGMFGGPIGAMIGQAIGNMVQDAVGDAVKGAVDQLQQNHGMPKFLAEQIKDAVSEAIQGAKKEIASDFQDQVQEAVGDFKGDLQDLTNELMQAIVKNAEAIMKQDKGNGSSGASKSKKPTSWLQAIAQAMGEAAGNKAAKLVELSNKLADLSSAGGDTEAQQQAAKEMNSVNAEFQATSQEYNMLQTAFSTAIKAIGEGMSAMSRKQ